MKLTEPVYFNILSCLLIIITTILIFYPARNLDLLGHDFGQITIITIPFGTNPFPFNIPLSYYFTQYGFTYVLLAIIFQIFGVNADYYYAFNIGLKVLDSTLIYFLISWWGKSRLVGLITSLFFLTSYAGIESSFPVVQIMPYIGIVLLCISLYFYRLFHLYYSKKYLTLSLLGFTLAIFVGHIRIFFLPAILFVGEVYFYLTNKLPRSSDRYKLRINH